MKKLSILTAIAMLSFVSLSGAQSLPQHATQKQCIEGKNCNLHELSKQCDCNCDKKPHNKKHRKHAKKALKKEAMEACKESADAKLCAKEYIAKKKAEWKNCKEKTNNIN